jgi:hypothetical protein
LPKGPWEVNTRPRGRSDQISLVHRPQVVQVAGGYAVNPGPQLSHRPVSTLRPHPRCPDQSPYISRSHRGSHLRPISDGVEHLSGIRPPWLGGGRCAQHGAILSSAGSCMLLLIRPFSGSIGGARSAEHNAADQRRFDRPAACPTDTVPGSDAFGHGSGISDIAWDAWGQSQSRAGSDRVPPAIRTTAHQCRHAADAAAAVDHRRGTRVVVDQGTAPNKHACLGLRFAN